MSSAGIVKEFGGRRGSMWGSGQAAVSGKTFVPARTELRIPLFPHIPRNGTPIRRDRGMWGKTRMTRPPRYRFASRKVLKSRAHRHGSVRRNARATADRPEASARCGGGAGSASRAWAGAARGAGVRGLPHRSARRRRRAAEPETAADPRARDRRHVVERVGTGADRFAIGDRVGVPWLGWTCGVCAYCRGGQENLCDNARFTGYRSTAGTPS